MKRTITACYFAACLFSASLLPAQQVRIVAMTGDPMPRGDGVFTTFGQVVLADSGEVAFEGYGQLAGTPIPTFTEGIYSSGGNDALHALAQRGDLLPNNRVITDVSSPAINASGQVVYNARAGVSSAYLVKDREDIVTHVNTGDTRSDGGGHLSASAFTLPHLDNLGRLTFYDQLNGVPFPDRPNPRGVFRSEANDISTVLVDEGSIPGDMWRWAFGPYPGKTTFASNDIGEIAIASEVRGPSSFRHGLFLIDGDTISEYPVSGLSAPNGNGVFTEFYRYSINDDRSVAFSARLSGTAGGSSDNFGLFRISGNEITELARHGDTLPDGTGSIVGFDNVQINALGQVMSLADVNVSGPGSNPRPTLLLSDGPSIIEVVRSQATLPDGSATVTNLGLAALNDIGQVVFQAQVVLQPTRKLADGIFLYDEHGHMHTVALTGTPFLGSTLTELSLPPSSGFDPSDYYASRNPLNNLGQVAYRFTLADGRQGVAVWSIPEVPTGFVASIAVMAIVVLRPRVRSSQA